MANVNLWVANPTSAAVTVNAQTVPAYRIKKLVIADTGADAYGFLAAGCAVISDDATTNLSQKVAAAEMLEDLLARQ